MASRSFRNANYRRTLEREIGLSLIILPKPAPVTRVFFKILEAVSLSQRAISIRWSRTMLRLGALRYWTRV